MQQWSKVPPGAITFVGFSHQCRACYRQALAIWCRLLALQRRDNAPVLNMTCSLCIAMHGVSVSGRTTRTAAPSANLRSGFSTTLRGQALAAPSQRIVASRAAFQVVAKQNSLKRQRTSEKARVYNKAHKSAVATRMKKVFKAVAGMTTELPSSEDAIKPIEKLISEAYQEIDKAVGKGILHANTGARRKAKVAAAKQQLLIDAGLYTPQS